MLNLGDLNTSETVIVPFSTFGGSAESITITGLAVTDIEVFKDGSATTRASDNGYTLLDTDGIDFAAITGVHGISIDLSDNSDAGFYANGSSYFVVISAITINAQTVSFVAATFTIGRTLRPTTAGRTLDIQATGEVDANVTLINQDSTAPGKLALMYNGTGYVDDTAPASRDQITGLTIASSAVHVTPIAAPNGFVLTTGSEVNDEDSTKALDGTRHELSDAAGTLDALYEFDIDADSLPVSVTFTGVFSGNNDSFAISANAGTDGTPVWQQVGTIQGTNSSANEVHSFDLFTDQIVTDIVGRVQIRINGTGLTSSSFDVDQVFVSKAIVARSIGYDGGAVWLDTNNGISGVVPYINGVADRHSDTIVNAFTIAAALPTPLTDFHIINGSSVTLVASAANKSFFGDNWILILNNQNVAGAYIQGAAVSGVGTSTSEVHYEGCDIGTMSVQLGHYDFCGFSGTVTMTLAGDYKYHNCYSNVAGAAGPTFTKTAGQAITAAWRNWADSITVSGIESGDTMTINGRLGTVTLNGADGTVEIRGTYKDFVDNRTGTPVLNMDGAIKGVDVASILTDTNELQTDWTDGGRLDLIVDAILVDTTEIGVDGAGLSNIPWNASWDGEVQSEVADALAVFWTSPATLVDLIYDEVNTGATHGGANSGGKQWRSAATTGLYEGGQIWIDTVNGSPGTDVDENGTMDSNSSNIADATTLLTAKGHSRFKIAPGSSFTLTQAYTNIIFEGDDGATIALGGQAITGCVFRGVIVTGTATGTGTIKFDNCLIGTDVLTCTLPPCHIDNSKIINDITSNAAGDYFFDKCSSGMAGTATWTFDFGAAIGTTNLNVRFNSGGIQLENMGDVGTDIASIEGWGQIIEGTCTGGTVAVRGNFTRSFLVTNNITWSEDARIDTDQITAAALATQMTESYAADGVAPTLTQAVFLVQQMLTEFAILGTELTAKKIDGLTTAATFTLDDATDPTSLTRTT